LPSTTDPRSSLAPGLENPGTVSKGIEHVTLKPKPPAHQPPTPADIGGIPWWNSDMAFQGNYAFLGNWNGFTIFDISNPTNPVVKTAVVCPGGQGDLSVYGNLLFMSVEENRGKKDCSLTPAANAETRMRGVRIFDISNIEAPVQVAQVQTCRGSHTHTLVEGKDSPDSVYIYVQGTAGVRNAAELTGPYASEPAMRPGCNGGAATTENPSMWRIEVIRVPLAAPQNAAIVAEPRLFRNEETGAVNGLQNQVPTPQHPSGIGWAPTPVTTACHDITVLEAKDLAAGSCAGNGILIDISDPANPRRIDAVSDPDWAYWHGATFSNDGSKVVFTDEWGGGTNERCRPQDQLNWGGNSIYEIVDRKFVKRSEFKLPAAQTPGENCVSHIPSVVPVPGRDIIIQAWYQGGASIWDWTDARNPREIGYFDRGSISAPTTPPTNPIDGGMWATYWYKGHVYATEMVRGFDVMKITATSDLTQLDLDNTLKITNQLDRMNPQNQKAFTWALSDEESSSPGGNVPATLSLTLGTPATFGAFTPGVARDYNATTAANVISTAGDARLSVADPSSTNTGKLVNGAFTLAQPLMVSATSAGGVGSAAAAVGGSSAPTNVLTYSGPISNDSVTVAFRQSIGANEALRTGTYSKTLTFTLSTTNP
jgi:LVIVD repeat-containing protein